MKLSIVIPTYNRLARLTRVLDALAAQTVAASQFEVIVVSDGSSDGTDEYLRDARFAYSLVPLAQANAGPAAARNLGVQRAQGDLIVFIDDDVVPSPGLLAEHLRSHAEAGERAVVVGPLVTPPGFAMQRWVRWEQDRLAEQYQDMAAGRWEPTARQFYTGNASLARRHLRAVGGFDLRFRRAEDVELGYRLADAGLRFVFNPAAVGYHYAERAFRSWLQTPYSYGRNDVIFTRDLGQRWLLPLVEREFFTRHLLVRWLARLCLAGALPAGPAVWLLGRLAIGCQAVGLGRAASVAFGALFNLRYYQGCDDELRARGERFNPQLPRTARRPVGPRAS